MRQIRVIKLSQLLLLFLMVAGCSMLVSGQTRCLSPEELVKLKAQFSNRGKDTLNKGLRNELLKLKEKSQTRVNADIFENRNTADMIERMRAVRQENALRLCQILKEYGWPSRNLVGPEGVDAAFFLLRDSALAQLKLDLLPFIVEAAKVGEVSKPDFASYIDRMRLDAGLKQLFATQATISDGFLVLYPIESETSVDDRRKEFELPPLADYVKFLQLKYQLPLIRATGALANKFSDQARASIAKSTNVVDGQAVSEDEIVRIDTNLVNLNVSVYSNKLRTHVDTLTQNDFIILEDGRPETVSYFATTDVPFDLVLLIDLSGSTADKRKLIRQSTKEFIEAKRPSDRLAIVTFSGQPNVISPLTDDKAQLIQSVKQINDDRGPSHVWEALDYTLKEVLKGGPANRRRAVVFMTDGVDNALMGVEVGSIVTFDELLETVRRSDTLIVPIYLDTEKESFFMSKRSYENARKTLALLAEETGGLYYKAKKIEDLDGVYRQVIDDLGKIYSLGYKPTNEKRDGKWRTVKIELNNLPDLKARTRPGYYAGSAR